MTASLNSHVLFNELWYLSDAAVTPRGQKGAGWPKIGEQADRRTSTDFK